MSDLETNQARFLAALEALDRRVQALKAGDSPSDTQALQAQVTTLEAQVADLRASGQETLKDLDLALAQLGDLLGAARG